MDKPVATAREQYSSISAGWMAGCRESGLWALADPRGREKAKTYRSVAEIAEEGRECNAKDSKAAKKTRRR